VIENTFEKKYEYASNSTLNWWYMAVCVRCVGDESLQPRANIQVWAE
jgi:hypothetical protein